MKTVTTIGGAMIDTIAVLDTAAIERIALSNADRSFLMLEEGSKTEATLISTHPGGGALNAAVSFARLGFTTSALVKLGEDGRAAAIRNALVAEGIGTALVAATAAADTGASMLVSAHERNAAVFTYRGANGLLDRADLPAVAFASGIVYVTGLSNRSAELFPHIVGTAHATGAFVAANPGIRQLTARGDTLVQSLPHLSMLSLNRDEAAALAARIAARVTGVPRGISGPEPDPAARLMRDGLSSNATTISLPQFMDGVRSRGVGCVVVTDGRHGSYAAVDDDLIFCPSLPARVVGTAGAGDAFSSTFAAFLASGSAPAVAMGYATLNAAAVVGVADAQSALLRRDAIEAAYAVSRDGFAIQSWRFEP